MRVQRTSCYGIVRKTVLQNVLEGLHRDTRKMKMLEDILSKDRSPSRVKDYVERRCVINIKCIEGDHMLNSGGQEAHVVGGWATAAEKATNNDIQKKINEHLKSRPSRSASMPSKCHLSKEDLPGGLSLSRSASVAKNSRPSKGTSEASCGRPRTAQAGGVKRDGLARTRFLRPFRGINDDGGDESSKMCRTRCDENDDGKGVSNGKPHIGIISGLDRGLRLCQPRRKEAAGPSSARSRELRTVQSGGVKKVKKSGWTMAGAPSKRRDDSSPGSSRASSSFEAVEDQSKTLVKKKVSTATVAKVEEGVERRDRTEDVISHVEAVHSQSGRSPGAPLVNLFKIAGHALTCDPKNRMRITSMTDEQYRCWGESFYGLAGPASASDELLKSDADLFMGYPLHVAARKIWDANWEAMGGNRLDANPRRPSELFEGLDKPLGPLKPAGGPSGTDVQPQEDSEASKDPAASTMPLTVQNDVKNCKEK